MDKTLATVHRDDGLFAQAPPTQCDVELDKVINDLEKNISMYIEHIGGR